MNDTKEIFTRKVTEFFERHDPSKLPIVPQIVDRFINHQDEVFHHLNELYVKPDEANITEESLLSLIPGSHEGSDF